MELDDEIFIILFFASGKTTREADGGHAHLLGNVELEHVFVLLQPDDRLFQSLVQTFFFCHN